MNSAVNPYRESITNFYPLESPKCPGELKGYRELTKDRAMDPIPEVILFSIIILELGLAFIYFPSGTGRNFYRLKMKQVETAFVFDPVLGYSFKPNIVYKNPTTAPQFAPRRIMFVDVRTGPESFLFTEDLSTVRQSHRMIFCLGGSSTAGTESSHNKNYPAIVDSLIKPDGYRCVNAGVGGYRSIHELLLFKNKILKLKPTAITIFSGYNDWEDYESGAYAKNDHFAHCLSHVLPTNRLEQILDYSALAHTAKKTIYEFKDKFSSVSKGEIYSTQDWAEQWKSNIGEIIDICKENNIQCFIIGQLSPVYDRASRVAKVVANIDLDFNDAFDEYLDYVKLMNRTCAELCEEKKVVFVDVARDFEQDYPEYLGDKNHRKRYSLFTDRIHFSEQGNMIMGSLIQKTLSRHLK